MITIEEQDKSDQQPQCDRIYQLDISHPQLKTR
jgi:hypothetical protein